MTKYIEVVNNSNVITIDDLQPRISLMRSVPLNKISYDNSGSYSWSSEYSWGNDQYRTVSFYRFPINLATNEKMFSIRALANNPHTGFSRLTSGSSKSYLYAYRNRYNSIGFSNYVIDFYGYDSMNTGTSGLQVFDENSKLIFNSNKYYLNVKGRFNHQHEDLWRGSFANDTSKFPRSIAIGGQARSNTAVIINDGLYGFCGYFQGSDLPPYDIVYTVVFGSTIYLEPRIAPWVNDWSTFPNNYSNHVGYPNFSRVSSGVFLDTTSIS